MILNFLSVLKNIPYRTKIISIYIYIYRKTFLRCNLSESLLLQRFIQELKQPEVLEGIGSQVRRKR